MRYSAAIPALALCAGVAAGILVSVTLPAALLVCLWLAAAASHAARLERGTIVFAVLGFFAAGLSLGRGADAASRNTPVRTFFERHVEPGAHQIFATVEGRLRADAVKGPSGATLDVSLDRIEFEGRRYEAAGGALIGVGGRLESDRILQWRAGRRVAFPATLRRPTRYLNHGVPDGDRQMAWRGTALVGSVKSDALVGVVAPGGAASELFAAFRAAVRRAAGSSVGRWSERSAAVVLAILIGDRAGLGEEVERRLQEAGTYHVVAISGGNIAIVAGLCIGVLKALRVGPRATPLLVIAVLAAYAAAVQGGSSVGRATLMAVIYFAARLWDLRTAPLNAAALTAAILLCADPLQAVDAGFALTFGATLGILAGMSAPGGMQTRPGWLRAPAALAAASICAEIALLPVSASVFSRITFAGLLVNFAAIPLMTIVQIAGMAAVAASLCVPEAAAPIGWVAHAAVEGLVGSAVLVEWMPWLTRRLAPPPFAVVALYYGSLLVLMALGRRSALEGATPAARPIAAAVCAGCGFWIVAAPSPSFFAASNILRVTVLDVGQGDASIVRFPNGRTLSIDAGGAPAASFDVAARVVSPAFWWMGVRRLDYMSVTHGDADHIGGAATLFRDFRPLEVWDGVPVPPHLPTRELRALADAAGATWRTLQRLDRVSIGGADVAVHHPPIPEWERQRVRNDDSQVVEIRYGAVSFVFTGDISREVERTIAPAFVPAPLRIVKVPHHGSATSSSQVFLDALRPDIAVISAGRGNPFGHPVPAVLGRYRRIGAAIYRTDQDGAVTMDTDGTTVRVSTFTGRQLSLSASGR